MPQYVYSPSENTRSGSNAKLQPGGPVEIGVVFDRSASMGPLRKAAVAGFNVLLDEQKKLTVPARFSLCFFNDEIACVHNGAPIANIGVMEPADYSPAGNTALLDGIGDMIERIAGRVHPAPYPGRVLVAILTDGQENSSIRFSKEEIFESISFRRAACDWQFLFMGVGGDTVATGLSLGIQRSNIVEFGADPEGIGKIMLALSSAFRAYQLGQKNYALLLGAGRK